MMIPCEIKKIGGSAYIVVNPLVLSTLKVDVGDILDVDFKGKHKEGK